MLVKCSSRVSGWAYDFTVWNPSIRKFHDIPSSPEVETSAESSLKEAVIGFGYDPLVKDYKCVKLILKNPNVPPLVAVYTLGSGLWKIIPFQGKGFSNFDWEFSTIRSVCLRGSLYFPVIHQGMVVLEFVSFDLNSEVFCSISLPADLAEIDVFADDFPVPTLVRFGCSSLALLDFFDGVSMWVWESESMCWTEPYAIDLIMSEFLYLKKNGDILMWCPQQEMSITLYSDKRVEQWCSLVTSYNLETREEKVLLLEKDNRKFEICEVYSYIESLLLLK